MKRSLLSATFCIAAAALSAGETQVVSFSFNGQPIAIKQSTDISPAKVVQFAMIPGRCDGACSTPMIAAPGVVTVGEFGVLEFLEYSVSPGVGLMIDARPPQLRRAGHIPSSINIPHETVAQGNPYRAQIFEALGGIRSGPGWDFSRAYDLVIFGSGPGTTSALSLISELIDSGYPASKLNYYRGGMQMWAGLGFSFDEPRS